MPGFTSTSMYPLLCEAAGISKRELVEKLIESAFNRYWEKQGAVTSNILSKL